MAMAECGALMDMVVEEDVVIVGAGIAGLATALGLHRLGMQCLVLESSDRLRVTGFALGLWTNAWKALEALDIADYLRQSSFLIQGFQVGTPTGKVDVSFGESYKNHEMRCVRRNVLLETLARELPPETIRYSSKVVSIDVLGSTKSVQLADGRVVRCKVLIGCDGIKSVVAKWLGLQNPINTGRSAIRGFVEFPDHGFQPNLHVYFQNGVRMGFAPCDGNTFYWFSTFKQTDANWHEDMAKNPDQLKSFVLRKAKDMPKELLAILERTNLDSISSAAALKVRFPWDIYTKDIAKSGISVAGDALHPMLPYLGQGGSSALEDGVVLARCIAESLLKTSYTDVKDENEAKTTEVINKCLENYVKERRWRCASLTFVSYVNGFIQDSESKVISFLKDKIFAKYIPATLLKMAEFDCGKLVSASSP